MFNWKKKKKEKECLPNFKFDVPPPPKPDRKTYLLMNGCMDATNARILLESRYIKPIEHFIELIKEAAKEGKDYAVYNESEMSKSVKEDLELLGYQLPPGNSIYF